MTRKACGTALALAFILAAKTATAQGAYVTGAGGYERFSASKSAKAVFDTTGGITFGGEVGYVFEGGPYVAIAVRTLSKTGERAFVADANGAPFRLGFPLTLRVTPIYVSGGYRFTGASSIAPYVGGGVGIALYRERSDFVGEISTLNTSKLAVLALAGAEVGRGSLRFGVEAAFLSVPNALGVGGVSKVYGEKDAGGLSMVAKLIWSPSSR